MMTMTTNGKIEVLGTTPRILITPEALQKMRAYTELSTDEIGWLGDVDILPNDRYLITDVFLVEQTAAATTCELKPDAMLMVCEEKLAAGEDVSKIKLWGHSHVNMSVSPSYQDNTQFEDIYDNASDFFIRLIMNKKDEVNISFIDLERRIIYHELPLTPYIESDVNRAAILAEIQQKVSKAPIINYKTYKNGYYAGTGMGMSYLPGAYGYFEDDPDPDGSLWPQSRKIGGFHDGY